MSRISKCEIIVKVISFVLILSIVLSLAGHIFIPYSSETTNQSRTFYKTERNTIDVMMIGSSSIMVGISPLDLWNDHGIVAYTLGSSSQPPAITYYYVKEAYNYQTPEVVVITMRGLFSEYDYDADYHEGFVRRGMDSKKNSFDKIETSYNISRNSRENSFLSYMFPILRYHDRWKDLSYMHIANMKYQYDYMQGQYPVYKVEKIQRGDVEKTSIAVEYDKTALGHYKRAIEYCQSQGSEVIAINLPVANWDYGKYIATKELCDEMDVRYIDYNQKEVLEDLGFDYSHDFYNDTHLNPIGAQKATKLLGEILYEEYGVENKKEEMEISSQMDADFEVYEERLNEFKKNTH